MGNMRKVPELIFKYRSYTPLPFLVLMLIYERTTLESMIIGSAITACGEFFRLWGVSIAGSETRTTGKVGGTFLIITGPFSYVRNPLYLGNILLYLGIGVMSMAIFPYLQLIAVLFFYIQYRIIISQEEKYLAQAFGELYQKYLESVPRLIPQFKAFQNSKIEQPPFNLKVGIRSEKRTLQALSIVIVILALFFVFKIE